MIKKKKNKTNLSFLNNFYENHKEKPSKILKFFAVLGKITSALVSLFFFILFLSFFTSFFVLPIDFQIPSGNIAILQLSGQITSDVSSELLLTSTVITPEKVRSIFEKLEKKDKIKAVIIELNSPGGTPVASAMIGDIFTDFKKPVIVVIKDLGASGAYWIATAADKIYAHPLSLVGSIGVTASHLGFEELIRNYNITYRRLISTKYKDTGSPFKVFTEDDKDLFDNILKQTHDAFVETVARNRNLSIEKTRDLANGFVYTGTEAKEFGLIDELGTRKDAVEYLEKELNITAELAEIKPRTGLFSGLGQGLYKGMYYAGKGFGSVLLETANTQKIEVRT
ncbi:signal peptide peptidase SppA [Candidatus Woesearchaeota archaeon]|nr:signal peptide peptidase SppA [Candidatus Woesearchaeota archaeon]